jgi:hypothetical protein
MARTNPGVIMRTSHTGSSPGGGAGRSRRRKPVAEPGLNGSHEIAPAAFTPGSRRSRSTASS